LVMKNKNKGTGKKIKKSKTKGRGREDRRTILLSFSRMEVNDQTLRNRTKRRRFLGAPAEGLSVHDGRLRVGMGRKVGHTELEKGGQPGKG